MSTATQPSQPKEAVSVINDEPITLDFLIERAAKYLLNPVGLGLIPLLAYFYDRNRVSASPSAYPGPSPSTLISLLLRRSAPYRALGAVWAFLVIRNLHLALNRYIRNHGEWKAQLPNWKKDVVVVTGGSAGIGKCAVEVLSHTRKAKIAVLDLAAPTYAPAPRGAPAILYIKTDVSDAAQVADAAAKIKSHFGADPSYVLNAAGIASGDTILDTSKEFFTKVWKVNSFSHFIMAQQFLPAMVKKGHGHFLTIASGASYACLPQMAPYACSKSAALAFHEVLLGELRTRYGANGRKVRASIFCPTKVSTGLGDTMEDHPNQFFTPVLTPIQCGWWLANVFESGLSQHIIAPSHAKLLPFWRVLPDYGRRLFEIIGHTDASMTVSSWKRAIGNGYTAWQS